jgi:methyl-accepting chemotaxis protein
MLAGEPAVPPVSSADAGFFSHHGLWAPGVRLFRNLGFRVKAALIALAFLVPLLVLVWVAVGDAREQLATTRDERAGIAYAKPLMTVLKAAQVRRRAVIGSDDAALAASQDEVKKRFAALQAKDTELAAELDTAKGFGELKRLQDALSAAPKAGTPAESYQAHTAFIDALRHHLAHVVGSSSLALDPESESYYLMLAGMSELPMQIAHAAQLRGTGGMALADGALSIEERVELTRLATLYLEADERVEAALASAYKSDAALEKRLPMAEADAASQAMLDALKARILAGEAKIAPDEWARLSSQAVDAQFALQGAISDELDALLRAREQRLTRSLLLRLGICALFVLLGAYLFHSFFLVMHGGLREVRRHMEAMTTGDLTQSPQPWGNDELAHLMTAMAGMQRSLRGMVARVRASSDDIVHSSSEISEGAMDLSARTEQTAASLEETASAMEEISATVKHTAEYALQATEIADHNADVALRGGEVIGQMVKTMEDIHASSNRIADIIGVIDGIAFQTNILALNAAVEAARAGESGRGFAVVAAEVRALAQRSAGAAREIKGLIGASVDQVEQGSRVVREAGDTMKDIVAGAERVKGLLGDIATGAREQSQGVGQVGTAVQELDQSTQQNAALVEQTAAASASLKALAVALSGQVANFRLPQGSEQLERAVASVSVADFDFDAAIEAHRAWKVKLRQAIAKQEKLDADTICRDDACALGRWLHGPGGQQWGTRPVFVELVDKHAAFHRTACGVAQAINKGRYQDADQLLGSGSAFAAASSEVGLLLTQAKRGF